MAEELINILADTLKATPKKGNVSEIAARTYIETGIITSERESRDSARLLKQLVEFVEVFVKRVHPLEKAGSKEAIELEKNIFIKKLLEFGKGKNVTQTVVKVAKYFGQKIRAPFKLYRVLGHKLGEASTAPIINYLLRRFNQIALPKGSNTLADIARRTLALVPQGTNPLDDSAVRNAVTEFLRNEFGKARDSLKAEILEQMARNSLVKRTMEEASLGLDEYKTKSGRHGIYFYFEVEVERANVPGDYRKLRLSIDIDHTGEGFAAARDEFLRTCDPEELRPIFDSNYLQFLESQENRVFIEKIRKIDDPSFTAFASSQQSKSFLTSISDTAAKESALRGIDDQFASIERMESVKNLINELSNSSSLSSADKEVFEWLKSLVDPLN